MATFHLLSFGCRASQADGAALKKQLHQAGFEESPQIKDVEVAVLNTCTVTSAADAEVRQVIRRIHRANPDCRILVTGCYAQRAPAEIAELPGVTWVVGNSHKHLVPELLEPLGRNKPQHHGESEPCKGSSGLIQIGVNSKAPTPPSHLPPTRSFSPSACAPQAHILVGEIPAEFHFAPVFLDDRTRPTVKIQDGCNARCSFCVIPAVRGRSRSLPPEKVIEQIRILTEGGTQEIVLSGINLGSYGKDFDRRITFLGLLERILSETAIARVRISSIEPMDVSPELILLVARQSRLADHFHVPLQSGSDRILRLMNRRYWAAQYAERILAICEQIPNCGIGADVMVGFPGETEREHAASVRLVESLPFTYLHIFPFSPRPGTRAAAMPSQVDGRMARERSQDMRSVISAKRQTFLEGQLGRTLSVLTLEERKGLERVALSSNYLKVALPTSPVSPNTLLPVRVQRVSKSILYGHPEARDASRT